MLCFFRGQAPGWLILAAALIAGCQSPGESDPGDAGQDADAASPDDGLVADAGADHAADGAADGGEILNDDGADGDGADGGNGGDAAPAWAPYAILSLNLHCLKLEGTGFATNQERFEAIAQAAEAEGVRALLVQEACVNQSGDAMALLGAALQTATGDAWSQAWEPAHTAWAGTPDQAEEGVGLFVRGAASGSTRLEYFAQGALRRLAVGVRLPAELGGFRLWSTHLEVGDPAVRLAQARQTASALLTLAAPSLDVLVGGDFNDTAGSAPCGVLETYGYTDLTDGLEIDRIDHLYAHRGAALSVLAQKTLFDGAATPVVSDHHGMLVVVGPAAPTPFSITRITAHVDVGWGNTLAVRGSLTPLDWQAGWPAVASSSDSWSLVVTGIPAGAAFEYKCLRNDADYQTGPNAVGLGGADNEVSPSF